MRTHTMTAALAIGTALIATTPLTAAPLPTLSRSAVVDAGATDVQSVHWRRYGYGYGFYRPYSYSYYPYSYNYYPSYSFYTGPRFHHRQRYW